MTLAVGKRLFVALGRLELTRRRPPLFAVFLAAGPTRDPEVLGSPEVQAQDAPGAQRHDDDPPTSRAQRRGSTDAEGAVPPVPPAAG